MEQRGPRPDVVATHPALSVGDQPIRLVDLVELDEDLGQTTLGLDEESLLVRPPQPTHRLPERLLRQSKLTALVVPRPGHAGTLSEDAIKAHVASYAERGVISRWAVPSRVRFLESIARTSECGPPASGGGPWAA